MNLGTRIKLRREELNMSQNELAIKLGYKSRSTINKIELGINDVTQHKIAAFAEALHTTPAYLMGWEETTIKKNDIASDIALELYSDEELLNLVKAIYDLPKEQRPAVQAFLSALSNIM